MLQVRKSNERGFFNFDWLKTYHTFSFGEYYDPQWIQFHSLRVINEDRVASGKGFPTHPHQNMEIITYVLSGALEHRDSMGNGSIIRAGEIQRMSAGTGITHSEFNASSDEEVHLYQIWILPERQGIKPEYEQKKIQHRPQQALTLLASNLEQEGAVRIHQDCQLYHLQLSGQENFEYSVKPGRALWIQQIKGSSKVESIILQEGDGMKVEDESKIHLSASESSSLLVFDLKVLIY
ncbi:MAG: pirin family protein [Deltaproteobacteria bacterium]|nr:pirin family protein [Deltaproteobacteria bacterium]